VAKEWETAKSPPSPAPKTTTSRLCSTIPRPNKKKARGEVSPPIIQTEEAEEDLGISNINPTTCHVDELRAHLRRHTQKNHPPTGEQKREVR